jgi:plastocyanin
MQNPGRCICLAATSLVLACGGGGGSTDPYNTGGNNPPPGGGNTALDNITVNFTQATMAAGDTRVINVVARDTQGAVIASATPTFASADESVAEVTSSGSLLAIHSGSTQISVTVTVGSVTKSAIVSVAVNGSLPTTATVAAGPDATFQPGAVVIAQGGSVTWAFGSVEHTVNFTTGGAGAPGAIGNSYNANVQRSFASKGNYQYMCSIHYGMSGEVIVR